jgi:hypothetical protein
VAGETSRVIRPAALLDHDATRAVLKALSDNDVAQGGVWNATVGLWQRYDVPWDGAGGTSGSARLVGTIATIYGAPTKYEILIYRVTVTAYGAEHGWSVEGLCDDALRWAGLTLADCPRAGVETAPGSDPFKTSAAS